MACCAVITTSFLRHVYLVIGPWIRRRFCLDVSAETCSRTRGASIAHASVDRCSAPSTLFACYRCASTARSARPSGVDGTCAPLLCSICAMVGRMAGTDGTVDSDRVEAYRETILDRATRHALHVARRGALRLDGPRPRADSIPTHNVDRVAPVDRLPVAQAMRRFTRNTSSASMSAPACITRI